MKIIYIPAGAGICCCGPPPNRCRTRDCWKHPDTISFDWHAELESDNSVCSSGTWELHRTEANTCIWESEILPIGCYGDGTHAKMLLQCIDEPHLWAGRTSFYFTNNEVPQTTSTSAWGPSAEPGKPYITGWEESGSSPWELVPIFATGYTKGFWGNFGSCGAGVPCVWTWDRFWY